MAELTGEANNNATNNNNNSNAAVGNKGSGTDYIFKKAISELRLDAVQVRNADCDRLTRHLCASKKSDNDY